MSSCKAVIRGPIRKNKRVDASMFGVVMAATAMNVCRFRTSCKVGLEQWRTHEFFRCGVQQIQLRTEDRQNGDLGGGSPPTQGFWKQL
jgi:hypothetical protein